jgi:hypothetical protein
VKLFESIRHGGAGSTDDFSIDRYNAAQQVKAKDLLPAALLEQYKEIRAGSVAWVAGLKDEELEIRGRHPFLGETVIREMIKMLPASRRETATIRDTAFADIVTGNDPKVQKLELAGLAAADMSGDERAQLRRLIELYVGRMNAASAKDALARLDRAGFEKVRFAWAGGIESGQPHYYRIHGPTLLIEYDDTQNEANHIHTVYRDLERDFGGDALRAHYRQSSHLSGR